MSADRYRRVKATTTASGCPARVLPAVTVIADAMASTIVERAMRLRMNDTLVKAVQLAAGAGFLANSPAWCYGALRRSQTIRPDTSF